MYDVLIIDDSQMSRELLGRTLEGQGYRTAWSAPSEGAAAIRKSAPALVILDPGASGSQGWRLLADLCRDGSGGPAPRVVIITHQTGKAEILRAAHLGVRDYMLKSRFSFAELLTRVRRHVVPGGTAQTPEKTPAPTATPVGQVPPKVVQSAKTTVGAAVSTTPIIVAAASADKIEDREAAYALAKELGLKLMTREQTLERLESAPVKTLPGVVAELISLVNSPRGTVSDVAQTLRRDPILTARILRVANSANFATQRLPGSPPWKMPSGISALPACEISSSMSACSMLLRPRPLMGCVSHGSGNTALAWPC